MAIAIQLQLTDDSRAIMDRYLVDEPRLIEKATERALRETLKQMSTSSKQDLSILQQIRSEVRIKAKDLRRHIRVNRARKSEAGVSGGIILGESERLPLKYFGARQTRRGVSYRIAKEGKRGKIKSAFIVKKLGDHVFVRVDRARLPLRKLMGPSGWGVFVKKNMTERTRIAIEHRLSINMFQELRFLDLKQQGVI